MDNCIWISMIWAIVVVIVAIVIGLMYRKHKNTEIFIRVIKCYENNGNTLESKTTTISTSKKSGVKIIVFTKE